MSSLLYTIYTNKIPILNKLLKDQEWMNKIVGKNVTEYDEIDHTSVCYIDDTSNIISFIDYTYANQYLNDLFQTLKAYYNSNRLCINSEKTSLVCIARPQMRQIKEEIYIKEEPKNIICKPQIRLLGWFFNERLSYDSTVNQNIGLIQNNINKLQECSKL